jgi:hypothetical protein
MNLSLWSPRRRRPITDEQQLLVLTEMEADTAENVFGRGEPLPPSYTSPLRELIQYNNPWVEKP